MIIYIQLYLYYIYIHKKKKQLKLDGQIYFIFSALNHTLRKKISAQPSQCRHDRLRRRRRSPGSPPELRRPNFENFHSNLISLLQFAYIYV